MMDQMMGFLGNSVLLNGRPNFTLSAASRAYRLRLLNGSNSRIYKLGWADGTPLTVIGTDGGLLERARSKGICCIGSRPAGGLCGLILAADMRSASRRIWLTCQTATPGGDSVFPILNVEVDRLEDASLKLPEQIIHYPWASGELRRLTCSLHGSSSLEMGRMMSWTINGRTFEMMETAKDEVVRLEAIEVWQFTNQIGGGMGMMGGGMALPHPMHIHGLQFQILEREISTEGRAAWETLNDGFVDQGWHDTVLVMPGERVKVLLKFEDFTGLYLYHCHNLEHEDMGMMRNYLVKA